mgnify:CR=1 FL=1
MKTTTLNAGSLIFAHQGGKYIVLNTIEAFLLSRNENFTYKLPPRPIELFSLSGKYKTIWYFLDEDDRVIDFQGKK